jgi:parallel beta-helix repeat protein
MKKHLLINLCFLMPYILLAQQSISFKQGANVSTNQNYAKDFYFAPTDSSLKQPALTILGNHIVIDFNNAILTGSPANTLPNQMKGLGINIRSAKKVTLKNLVCKGFKLPLLIQNCDSVEIENCDFSYNYRPKISSTFEKNDQRDSLFLEDNEKNEWQKKGCAIYISDSKNISIKNVKITQGLNGIMLVRSSNCTILNNQIQFNSGAGIALYRSTNNLVAHNKLDWNVRQNNAAGIIAIEQSSGNTFAKNSITHCDYGILIFSGKETLNSGKGGSNDNFIYQNDCSYATQSGIKMSFCGNALVKNTMIDCKIGIETSYCFASTIWSNVLKNNEIAVTMEHPMENLMRSNTFENNQISLQTSTRATQPEEWIFYNGLVRIMQNDFKDEKLIFDVKNTKNVFITGNIFHSFKALASLKGENVDFQFEKNFVYQDTAWADASPYNLPMKNMVTKPGNWTFPLNEHGIEPFVPKNLPENGMETGLTTSQLKGKSYILMEEWGPYNFEYPKIILRKKANNDCEIELLGTKDQTWGIQNHSFKSLSAQRGIFPAKINATLDTRETPITFQLNYIGQPYFSAFGEKIDNNPTLNVELKTIQK